MISKEQKKAIANRIKITLATKGMTNQQLADRLGVSRQIISSYKAGKLPSDLAPMAKALDVDTDWLINGAEGPILLTVTYKDRYQQRIYCSNYEIKNGIIKAVNEYTKAVYIINMPEVLCIEAKRTGEHGPEE